MDSRSVQGNAVVVGAGVMGAQIAAHLANAGWHASLLDIVPEGAGDDPKARNAYAARGLERSLKARPAAFFVNTLASRVAPGNTTDDLRRIKDADWVVEAVVEKPEIKQQVHAAIEPYLRPDALITTNTSGLSITEMANACSPAYRARLFGTHFFNPPRYMKLMELIPTAATDRKLVDRFADFAETVLGKRVVIAKDTPGFIANRLGIYSMMRTLHATLEHGLTIEQVDALTGPVTGHPRSATYRLQDIVGLDVTVDVSQNLKSRLPDDSCGRMLALPDLIREMVQHGQLGEKSGGGFYKRMPDRSIQALDLNTRTYRPRQNAAFPSVEALKSLPLAERLRALLKQTDVAGTFLWETTRDILCYAAEIASEIADDIVSIDNAIRWGFNWELGPFETWDALGLAEMAARLEQEARPVPALVTEALKSGRGFYHRENGKTLYFALPEASNRPATGLTELPSAPEFIDLGDLKAQEKTIKATPDATLIDLGDGVSCLEFHTKMNVLGPGTVQMIDWSRDYAERNGIGLVIGNQGEHFSAGFNIQLLLMGIYEQDWDEMLMMTKQLQDAVLRLKRATVPVVAACHGYTLGGGCEVMLHCAAAQFAAESYVGLPESGLGLLPGGGGTTEMAIRSLSPMPTEGAVDPYAFLHAAWVNIGMAKVATSAEEARGLGYLRASDRITMGTDRVLHEAKQRVLALSESSFRPAQPATLHAMGEEGIARFDLELHLMKKSGFISEHDALVGHEIATVLCGGNLVHAQTVSEEYVLQVEREAFVRLAATEKTAARVKHFVETGKPLRN